MERVKELIIFSLEGSFMGIFDFLGENSRQQYLSLVTTSF